MASLVAVVAAVHTYFLQWLLLLEPRYRLLSVQAAVLETELMAHLVVLVGLQLLALFPFQAALVEALRHSVQTLELPAVQAAAPVAALAVFMALQAAFLLLEGLAGVVRHTMPVFLESLLSVPLAVVAAAVVAKLGVAAVLAVVAAVVAVVAVLAGRMAVVETVALVTG